jgi:hypothetical protein
LKSTRTSVRRRSTAASRTLALANPELGTQELTAAGFGSSTFAASSTQRFE